MLTTYLLLPFSDLRKEQGVFYPKNDMKTKNITILILFIILISFLLGITQLIPLANTNLANHTQSSKNQKDTLIGVFVTKESLDLFDIEAYLKEHGNQLFSSNSENVISPEDNNKYQRKIYATPIEIADTNADGEPFFRKEYAFPNLDGYLLCHAKISDSNGAYCTTIADAIFCDIDISLSSTDNGEHVTLSAMIYSLVPKDGVSFFFNPVYQTATGEVYLISGTGSSVSGEVLGSTSTHTLEDSISFSNAEGIQKTDTATIQVSFQLIAKTDTLILSQMDANHHILESQTYRSGEMPSSITPLDSTAYLLLESISPDSDGNTVSSYELYDKDDTNLVTFIYKTNGVCVNTSTSITWESAQ